MKYELRPVKRQAAKKQISPKTSLQDDNESIKDSEIEELKPCNLRPHVDCDLNYRLIPSLYDGKQKKIMTKTS